MKWILIILPLVFVNLVFITLIASLKRYLNYSLLRRERRGLLEGRGRGREIQRRRVNYPRGSLGRLFQKLGVSEEWLSDEVATSSSDGPMEFLPPRREVSDENVDI